MWHAGDGGTGSRWGCSRQGTGGCRLVPATSSLPPCSCHPHPVTSLPCHPLHVIPIPSPPSLPSPSPPPHPQHPQSCHPIPATLLSATLSRPPSPCHLHLTTPFLATLSLPPPTLPPHPCEPIPVTPSLPPPSLPSHPCHPIPMTPSPPSRSFYPHPATPVPVTLSPLPQPAGGRWPRPAPVPGRRAPCGGCAATAVAGACGMSSQQGAMPVGGCRALRLPRTPSLCHPGVLVTSATTTLPMVPAGDARSPASSTAPATSTRQPSVTCQPWGQATSSLGGTAAPTCIGWELSPGALVPPHWWHPQCPCVTPHSRHRCWPWRRVPSPRRAAGSHSRRPPPAPHPGWPRCPAAAWGQGQAGVTSPSPPAQRRVPRVLTAAVAPQPRVRPSASPWGAGSGGGAALLCQ